MYPAATVRARPLTIAFGDLPTWVGAIGTVLGCHGLEFVASAYRGTSFGPGRIGLDKRWGDWLAMKRVEMPVSLVEAEDGFILTAYPRAEPDAKRLGGIVRFTDAGKRHWQIDEAGALTELEDCNGW